MSNDDLHFVRRLQQSVTAIMRSSEPFSGDDISDIACALDWEKNRHAGEVKAMLEQAVDKLHAAAAVMMIEEHTQ